MQNLYAGAPNLPEIIGCDQHRTTFFYCYCYGEAHQQRIMSGEIQDTSLFSVVVHLVANNGCCVNTCISTKDFVKICRYVYQNDAGGRKMGGPEVGAIPNIYQYQMNRIIAEKSTNVCINQCLHPFLSREAPAAYAAPCRLNRRPADASQRMTYRATTTTEKTNTIHVTLPPPGFPNDPSEGKATSKDDDLDVDEILEEFRAKSKIHVDYEKRFVITRFFFMNLNAKILKFVRDNKRTLKYQEALNCVSPEKLFVLPAHLLRRFGFDVLFVDDEETTFVSTRRCQTRTVLNPKIVNSLAMEVVGNDAFVDELVEACSSHLDKNGGRMPYVKMFGTTD